MAKVGFKGLNSLYLFCLLNYYVLRHHLRNLFRTHQTLTIVQQDKYGLITSCNSTVYFPLICVTFSRPKFTPTIGRHIWPVLYTTWRATSYRCMLWDGFAEFAAQMRIEMSEIWSSAAGSRISHSAELLSALLHQSRQTESGFTGIHCVCQD